MAINDKQQQHSKKYARAAQTIRVATALQPCGISVWQLPCGNSAYIKMKLPSRQILTPNQHHGNAVLLLLTQVAAVEQIGLPHGNFANQPHGNFYGSFMAVPCHCRTTSIRWQFLIRVKFNPESFNLDLNPIFLILFLLFNFIFL